MIECGYNSKLKHETCNLPKSHEVRHFDFNDAAPMMFSVKAYNDVQKRRANGKRRAAKHICGCGSPCSKYCKN